jgi:hypothetical protein
LIDQASPNVKPCRAYLDVCKKVPCDDVVKTAECTALLDCYDNGSQCQSKVLSAYDTLIPPFVTQCLIDTKPCAQEWDEVLNQWRTLLFWQIGLYGLNFILFVGILIASCIFQPN